MNISVVDEQKDLSINASTVEDTIKSFLQLAECECDEVTVHFVDTPTICQLHADFFDDPTTTDCISFPMDGEDEMGYKVLGEVFVCPQTAIDYVAQHGGDPYLETTLYMIHGLLHLLGYDDIEEQDAKEMRKQEAVHLDHLRKADKLIKRS